MVTIKSDLIYHNKISNIIVFLKLTIHVYVCISTCFLVRMQGNKTKAFLLLAIICDIDIDNNLNIYNAIILVLYVSYVKLDYRSACQYRCLYIVWEVYGYSLG